jgi:galactokinase
MNAHTVTWSAPGRVNLIGEHTDYNDGYVLPFAIEQRTHVAVTPHGERSWTVGSRSMPEAVTFTESDLVPHAVAGWAGYVAGVVAVLRDAGIDVPGARITVDSAIPVGAGLSSSAALECATLAALLDVSHADIDRARWPSLAQLAENAYVGVPCGILDQAAATLCTAGHALFLDCRSRESQQVPFDLAAAGLALLVIDTQARHRNTDGEYAVRRHACEAAARILGLPALRDVGDLGTAMDRLTNDVLRRRARHIITENARVLNTVDLLRAGRYADIGPVLTASHMSMRDDFEITVTETDTAVDAAIAGGALGARMTGAGFGGSVLALVEAGRATAVAAAIASAFAAKQYPQPHVFAATARAGVARN